MKKPEILAPAGDLDKLKAAILYGADAVYLGGEEFGLRTASKNFTPEEMKEGIDFAHQRGKKVYITCNIIPHNEDFKGLREYLIQLQDLGADALIIADPGVLMVAREATPKMEIHWSTQANNTNYHSANFWYTQGVRRIVVARELSLQEIEEIRRHIPADMEIEAFVHGAMCISYSGRCLISNYMIGRDANRGACAQSCRWKYHLMEETRPGEYYPVEEDEKGTYLFNAKDLCMVQYLPELIRSGIASFKIEGRVKTPYYVATIVRAYRMALDAYWQDPKNYRFDPTWLEEVQKCSHRDYTTGFYLQKPDASFQNYESSQYLRSFDFVASVLDYDETMGLTKVEIRNRIFQGDQLEMIAPELPTVKVTVKALYDLKRKQMECAPRPMEILWMDLGLVAPPHAMLRKSMEK